MIAKSANLTEIKSKEEIQASVQGGASFFLSYLQQIFPDLDKRRERCEKKIGFKFRHPVLLFHALTHRSLFNEKPTRVDGKKNLNEMIKGLRKNWSNERLEFLGDAVLSLSISTYLYHHENKMAEGKLSLIRSSLVNETSLAELARTLELGQFIFLGKGEHASGGAQKNSLLADTLEAIIGAVYIDRGFKAAEKFVLGIFGSQIKNFNAEKITYDYKTLLQELTQKYFKATPSYKVMTTQGADHKKTFTVSVNFSGTVLANACGSSIKRASQEAAKKVFDVLSECKEDQIASWHEKDLAKYVQTRTGADQ